MMNFPRRAHFPCARMMNERRPPREKRRAPERSNKFEGWAMTENEFIASHPKSSFELAGLSTLRLSVLARAFISTRFGPSRVVCGPSGSAEQSQNTGNCDLVAHSFDGNGLDNRRALCFIIHIISGIIVIIGPQRFYRSPTRRPPVNAARKSRFPLKLASRFEEIRHQPHSRPFGQH